MLVSLLSPAYLRSPVLYVGRRHPGPFATMPMPKASVNKHRQTVTGQHDIRGAGNVFPMQAKTKTGFVQRTTNGQFTRCVLTLDSRHRTASDFRRDCVRNGLPPLQECNPICRITQIREHLLRVDRIWLLNGKRASGAAHLTANRKLTPVRLPSKHVQISIQRAAFNALAAFGEIPNIIRWVKLDRCILEKLELKTRHIAG